MKKENKILIDVMYDSIDLFLQLKHKSCILGDYANNTDKAIICLYLSLINKSPLIKNKMEKLEYKYDFKIRDNKPKLSIEEYYKYHVKYFYEFLNYNRITKETSCNELMSVLLNTGIVEKINIKYKYNHELLKRYFNKLNKYEKTAQKILCLKKE